MDSVLIDTSFCIRLIKQTDPLHKNAVEYFEYFIENKVIIYLSSIAIAEYSVKDDANNLPLKNDLKDIERNVIKDDCKLIAQFEPKN